MEGPTPAMGAEGFLGGEQQHEHTYTPHHRSLGSQWISMPPNTASTIAPTLHAQSV